MLEDAQLSQFTSLLLLASIPPMKTLSITFVVAILAFGNISTLRADIGGPGGGDGPSGSIVSIMAMGDSNTRGFIGEEYEKGAYRQQFTSYMDRKGLSYDMVGEFDYSRNLDFDGNHQGVGGHTIQMMTQNYRPAVRQFRPDVVFLMAGTNNHIDDLDYETFYGHYDDLLSMIKTESPTTRVIISTVPKFGCCRYGDIFDHWTEDFVEHRNTVTFPFINGVMQDVAATYNNVEVIDFFSRMSPHSDLTTDQVHLNKSGHRKLGRMFFEAYANVPEPSSAIVLGAGMLLASLRRRKR